MNKNLTSFLPYIGVLLLTLILVVVSLFSSKKPSLKPATETFSGEERTSGFEEPLNFPGGNPSSSGGNSQGQSKKNSSSKPRKNTAPGAEKPVYQERGKTLMAGKWGSAQGQFGVDKQGHRPGPMSLFVDKQGRTLVLDQENYRIQIFDGTGKYLKSIPLSSNHYELLSGSPDGSSLALYNPETRTVEIIGTDGSPLREQKLPQNNLAVSEVWVSGGDLYVEYGHNQIYRYSSSGSPVEIPGRPLGENRAIKANQKDSGSVEILCFQADSSGEYSLLWKKTLSMASSTLTTFQTDAQGNIYLGWRQFIDRMVDGERKIILNERRIMKLDSQGNYLGDTVLSSQEYADSRRAISVSPSGTIYQMTTSPEGARIGTFEIQKK